MDILIVDDEKIIRDATIQLAEDSGHYAEGASTGALAMEMLKETPYDLVLLDLHIGRESGLDLLDQIQKKYPNVAIVVFTAAATVKSAVDAMRRGALDFLEKPFTAEQLNIALARVQKHRRLAERVVELQTQITNQSPEPVFESQNPSTREVLDVLFRAADTPASVLILGESGTGKSVAARAVHQKSLRAEKPFVVVNCPSLSKELLESELFGHTKGAFTGAVRDHWGKVKAADGGTLFLDEIGELPVELQPKLLRLLQDREYERVGETVTRRADVRIISATNKDLARSVENGTFREDLLYRLNVITVEMPPLRRRPDDLLSFAERYLQFFAGQFGRPVRSFSAAARQQLLAHGWAGNLRELRNAVERAVILARGNLIEPSDIPTATVVPVAGDGNQAPTVGSPISLEELETAHIRSLLQTMPSLADAARILGIDQATLYRKRKKFGLE